MQLDWPFDWCAFCLCPFGAEAHDPRRRTDSHVIPESLGGSLSTTALCFTCNSRTGTKFESSLPLDPTLRSEMQRFASAVPAFAKQQSKAGRLWVAKTAQGNMRMKRTKRGGWLAVDSSQPDGSRLADSRKSVDELRGRLESAGADEVEIKNLLSRFATGEDVRVGEWTFRPLTGDLELEPWGECANDRAFLSIATHFLATVIGSRISNEELGPARRALAAEGELGTSVGWVLVPQAMPRPSEPWHRLTIAQGKPFVIVDVTLFGRWRYLVLYPGVAWERDRWGVRFDLPSRHVVSQNLEELADSPSGSRHSTSSRPS